MYLLEQHINSQSKEKAISVLLSLIDEKEKTDKIIFLIDNLVSTLFKLEANNWNRIWARIIKNFLTTSNLGKFEVIIGNPPWIDWKNLPTGYREKIKALCIKKELFSGDSLTGGINLNICALITNVVAENWLSEKGNLAFLMPKSLIFQQTYEGFRKLKIENNKRLYIKELHDWTKSGSPFFPVQLDFLTYYFSFEKPKKNYVDVKLFVKRKNKIIKDKQTHELSEIRNYFDTENLICGQLQNNKTAYTYANNEEELKKLKKISGESHYKGREGIEFYPQEIFVLKEDSTKSRAGKGIVWVKNIQNTKSKYKIPEKSFRLEKDYLFPLVKGVDIEPFNLKDSNLLAPFPYEFEKGRNVLNAKELQNKSPLLFKYFKSKREILDSQSEYNSKIQGKYGNIFYSLTRVGEYSFAPYKVVYRDNTKWCASVISEIETSFGEKKLALPQNHAPYMSQNKNKFITKEEAHYICAIMNSPTVEKFMLQSSDTRTFKITPPIFIPEYNNKNKSHKELSNLSIIAHKNKTEINNIRLQIDKIYLSICNIK